MEKWYEDYGSSSSGSDEDYFEEEETSLVDSDPEEISQIRTISSSSIWDLHDRESYHEIILQSDGTYKLKETFVSQHDDQETLKIAMEHMTEQDELSFKRSINYLSEEEKRRIEIKSPEYHEKRDELGQSHWSYTAEASGKFLVGFENALILLNDDGSVPDHSKYSPEDLERANKRSAKSKLPHLPKKIEEKPQEISLAIAFKKANLLERIKAFFTRQAKMTKAEWQSQLETAIKEGDYQRFYDLLEMVDQHKVDASAFSVSHRINQTLDGLGKSSDVTPFLNITQKLGQDSVYANIVALKLSDIIKDARKSHNVKQFLNVLRVAHGHPAYLEVFAREDVDDMVFHRGELNQAERVELLSMVMDIPPNKGAIIWDAYLSLITRDIIWEKDNTDFIPTFAKVIDHYERAQGSYGAIEAVCILTKNLIERDCFDDLRALTEVKRFPSTLRPFIENMCSIRPDEREKDTYRIALEYFNGYQREDRLNALTHTKFPLSAKDFNTFCENIGSNNYRPGDEHCFLESSQLSAPRLGRGTVF